MDKVESINLDNIDSNINTSSSSSNLMGIELLMNDKKKVDESKSPKSLNISVINDIENEVKELDSLKDKNSSIKELKSDIFKTINPEVVKDSKTTNDIKSDINPVNLDNLDNNMKPINLKTDKAANDTTVNKTWDGMSTFNDIPINPEKPKKEPELTKEEMLREKFKYLKKLEELEKKGVSLSKKYTMESPLLEMQGEYETLLNERELKNSCKFQGRMLMAAITGIEFLNNKFDPFDINLEGWGEQVNENIEEYDEIFSELHEKYKSKAKMAPELKLLFQLGGSAIMVHMTNTMFKSSLPGMDDIMKQNPELMQKFTEAAVNQMNDTSPGFSGFMNNMMNNKNRPPSPMKAREVPFNNRRSDLDFGRGSDNDGINITQSQAPAEEMLKSNINGLPGGFNAEKRNEMKGPTNDISNLLSGLKTKVNTETSSTISLDELKELKNSNIPTKTSMRSKPKSDKNTVSLNI